MRRNFRLRPARCAAPNAARPGTNLARRRKSRRHEPPRSMAPELSSPASLRPLPPPSRKRARPKRCAVGPCVRAPVEQEAAAGGWVAVLGVAAGWAGVDRVGAGADRLGGGALPPGDHGDLAAIGRGLFQPGDGCERPWRRFCPRQLSPRKPGSDRLLRDSSLAAIVNNADRELPVPQTVIVTLSDAGNHELYHWPFKPGAQSLKPKQSIPFFTRLSSPPAAARRLEVRLPPMENDIAVHEGRYVINRLTEKALPAQAEDSVFRRARSPRWCWNWPKRLPLLRCARKSPCPSWWAALSSPPTWCGPWGREGVGTMEIEMLWLRPLWRHARRQRCVDDRGAVGRHHRRARCVDH